MDNKDLNKSDINNELDQYGVWVKTPPHNAETAPEKAEATDSLNIGEMDFSFLDIDSQNTETTQGDSLNLDDLGDISDLADLSIPDFGGDSNSAAESEEINLEGITDFADTPAEPEVTEENSLESSDTAQMFTSELPSLDELAMESVPQEESELQSEAAPEGEQEISLDDFISEEELSEAESRIAGANGLGEEAPEAPAPQESAPEVDISNFDDGEISLDAFISMDELSEAESHIEGARGHGQEEAFAPSSTDNFAPDGEISLDAFLDDPSFGESTPQEAQQEEEEGPLDIDLSFDDTVEVETEDSSLDFAEFAVTEDSSTTGSSIETEAVDFSEFLSDSESSSEPRDTAKSVVADNSSSSEFEMPQLNDTADSSTPQDSSDSSDSFDIPLTSDSSEEIDLSEFGLTDTEPEATPVSSETKDFEMNVDMDDDSEFKDSQSVTEFSSEMTEDDNITLETDESKEEVETSTEIKEAQGDDSFNLDDLLNNIEDENGNTVSFGINENPEETAVEEEAIHDSTISTGSEAEEIDENTFNKIMGEGDELNSFFNEDTEIQDAAAESLNSLENAQFEQSSEPSLDNIDALSETISTEDDLSLPDFGESETATDNITETSDDLSLPDFGEEETVTDNITETSDDLSLPDFEGLDNISDSLSDLSDLSLDSISDTFNTESSADSVLDSLPDFETTEDSTESISETSDELSLPDFETTEDASSTESNALDALPDFDQTIADSDTADTSIDEIIGFTEPSLEIEETVESEPAVDFTETTAEETEEIEQSEIDVPVPEAEENNAIPDSFEEETASLMGDDDLSSQLSSIMEANVSPYEGVAVETTEEDFNPLDEPLAPEVEFTPDAPAEDELSSKFESIMEANVSPYEGVTVETTETSNEVPTEFSTIDNSEEMSISPLDEPLAPSDDYIFQTEDAKEISAQEAPVKEEAPQDDLSARLASIMQANVSPYEGVAIETIGNDEEPVFQHNENDYNSVQSDYAESESEPEMDIEEEASVSENEFSNVEQEPVEEENVIEDSYTPLDEPLAPAEDFEVTQEETSEEEDSTQNVADQMSFDDENAMILKKIASELSTLKSEISDLKAEFADIKKNGISSEEESQGFFDVQDEDDSISLNSEEMSHILDSADFTNSNQEEGKMNDDDLSIVQPPILENLQDDENDIFAEDLPTPLTDRSFDYLESEVKDEELGDVSQAEEPTNSEELSFVNTEFDETEDEAEEDETLEEGISENPVTNVFTSWENNEELSDVEEPEELSFTGDIETQEEAEAEPELTTEEPSFTGSFDVEEPEESVVPTVDSITSDSFDSAETESEPEEEAPASSGFASIPKDMKEEIKSVLTYMDQLLENLPDDKITEFARSKEFDTYKKLFDELGLSK